MLVLSRKCGQSIRIGDSVVTVTGLRRGRVQLGVTASPETKIMRCEVDQADTEPPAAKPTQLAQNS